MWLENMDFNRTGMYESEYDLFVNMRNPYYIYPSQAIPPGLNFLNPKYGCYSKEEPFIIQANGLALLKHDAVNTPTISGGLVYTPPYSGPYLSINEPMKVCCFDFSKSAHNEDTKLPPEATKLPMLRAYPNPNRGDLLMVEWHPQQAGTATLSLTDMTGRQVYNTQVNMPSDIGTLVIPIDLGVLRLPPGIYALHLTDTERAESQLVFITQN